MNGEKTITLSDGTIVVIQPLTGKEDPQEFQRFINTLTKEGTYLLVSKHITLKEEEQWLSTQLKEQRNGQQIYLKALVDGRLIGDCFSKPGFGRNKGNVNLGIALAKEFRGKGLGRLLLLELIERSERKWHPKNIYLHVVSENTTAYHLYESLGFRPIARLPQWFEYNEGYLDEYLLILNTGCSAKKKKKKKKNYPGTKKR